MSVRTDVINLRVNVEGNPALKELNELRKKAADVSFELKGMKEGTKEFIDKTEELKNVNSKIDTVRKGVGLTSLSMRELLSEQRNLNSLFQSSKPGTEAYKQYEAQLIAVKQRLAEVSKGIKGVQNATSSAHEENNGFAQSFGKIFEKVAEYTSAYAILEGIKEFFTGTIEEADKAEQATSNLLNTLANAGRTDVFEELNQQAERFADTYKKLNANDVKNVFTKLIDYGKLTKTQISQLTDVIINYAAKQKISLEDATDVFTKALEGNAKGLKTYGINLNDAANFGQRLNLVLGPMADKVKGAEAAFEQTSRGGLEIFKEGINRIKERIGLFILDLVSAKKSSDQLFDQAKLKTDEYQNSLTPLLARYDELKNKTSLNKNEQSELQGIIEKIVEIVPSAATEFNKYGIALDINKSKVTSFLEANKQFLAEKEYKAVNEITNRTLEISKSITQQEEILNKQQTTDIISGGGIAGTGGTSITRKSTQDEDLERKAQLRVLQEKLITDADILTDKYGKKLPAAIEAEVAELKKLFGTVEDINKQTDTKVIGNGDPNSDEKKKAVKDAEDAAKVREESLKRAADFHKRELEEIAKANREQAEELKANYKAQADDQSKSLQERYAALLLYSQAGTKLIQQNKIDAQLSLNNEIAEDKKNAKSKEEVVAIEGLRKAKQYEIDKSYALSTSKFEIEVSKEYTIIAEQDYKKVSAAGKEAYEQLKQHAENSYKYQQDKITLNTDDKLLQLDKDFQDKKIATLQQYQQLRANIIADGKKQEIEYEIASLQVFDKILKAQGIISVDLAKKIEAAQLELNSININQQDTNKKNDKASKNAKLAAIKEAADQTLRIASDTNQFISNLEDRELDKEKKRYDAKKNNYDKLLSSHLVSQKRYNTLVANADQEYEKKKADLDAKSFKRQQAIAITTAVINGALGISAVFAARPGLADVFGLAAARAILVGLTIAETAAQIGVIASAKPPEAAKGGIFKGPSHKDGGMTVYDNRTGKPTVEVEGEEPFLVLSKNTLKNNGPIIHKLLDVSLNKNGASITDDEEKEDPVETLNRTIRKTKKTVVKEIFNSIFTRKDSTSVSMPKAAYGGVFRSPTYTTTTLLPKWKTMTYPQINLNKILPILANGGIVNNAGNVNSSTSNSNTSTSNDNNVNTSTANVKNVNISASPVDTSKLENLLTELIAAQEQNKNDLAEALNNFRLNIKSHVVYKEITDAGALLDKAKSAAGINKSNNVTGSNPLKS